MASNKIYLQVDFQSEGANAAINTLNTNIKNIGTTSTKATKDAEAGFNSLNVSISQTTRGLDQMGGILAGLGISRAFIGMAQAADDITRTSAAFQAMGANAGDALNAIEAIRTIAKTQPFSFDDLRDMAQRLRGFGFDLKQIPSIINNVADAAAALGKGKIAIDSITLALGQMRAKGLIQGQEAFRQLAEQGINSVKYLQEAIKKETGKAVSSMDVRTMIEKQMIGAEKGVQVILDGMAKEFGGAGKKMADAMSTVQVDKLMDDLKKLGAAIAKDFTPAIIKMIGHLREAVHWFGQLPVPIQNTTLALGLLAIALTAVGAAAKLGLFAWIPAGINLIKGLIASFAAFRVTLSMMWAVMAEAGTAELGFARLWLMLSVNVIPALATLATVMLTVAAAWAGMKAGEWMREKIDPDSWLGKLLGKDTEAKATAFGAGARADLERTAQTYQKWMKDMKLEGADKFSLIPFSKQTDVELEDSLRNMRQILDAEGVAAKARAAKLIVDSKENAKHHNEIADQILERAQARIHGAIFGLTDKYKGALRELAGDTKNTAKVLQALALDLEEAQKKLGEENIKTIEEANKKRIEGAKALGDYFENYAKAPTEFYKRHLEYVAEVDKLELDLFKQRLDAEKTLQENNRDDLLGQLDETHRQTLAQEIAYQQDVLTVKTRYAYKIRDIELELNQKKTNELVAAEKAALDAKLISQEDYDAKVSVLHRTQAQRSYEIIAQYDMIMLKDRIETQKKINDAVIEEQKKIYDKLKSSLDRVFDALLDKSTSVWQAMGNALKTAIIGAIKEIVTSRAAAALMQMFGYGAVAFGGGPRGLGGQQPTFGGAMATVGGGGSFVANAARWLGIGGGGAYSTGAGGTTAGQAALRAAEGPVGMTGMGAYGGYSSAAGGAGQLGQVATPAFGASALLKGGAALAGTLGGAYLAAQGIQKGGGVGLGQAIGGGAMAGIGLAHLAPALLGTGGPLTFGLSAAGGGLLGAGIGLAGYGLYRGGKAGIPLTAAGGAMIGATLGTVLFPGIGTVLGAGIGAAVGGIAGLFRSFVKTADQKLQEKLKQVYAIDVTDKNLRAQILEMAKSKYGGNLDMTVRSKEVMDLVQLYAMSTGKSPQGMPRPMYGATLSQSGSGLTLQPVYSGGQLITSPYSGMTTSQWSQQGIYLQLNPQQANDLFEGKVVNVINTNPEAVGLAAATSSRSGSARDAQRTALMEPLTVVR